MEFSLLLSINYYPYSDVYRTISIRAPVCYWNNKICFCHTKRRDALYEGSLYEVHDYTVLLKGGRAIQGDVLIEESALNEEIRLLGCC